MNRPVARFAAVIALATLLALPTGCGTSMPARFYRMSPTVAGSARPNPALSAATMSAGIGPIEVPAYLDHPQIVTQKAGNELGYAEYDRWAGSFQSNIADVLVEDISSSLAGEGVSVHPWDLRVPFDYQVEVRITGFEGYPGKSVSLNATWTVINPSAGRKVVVFRRSIIDKGAQGPGYAAYVDAMNGALAELAQEIADELKSLRASPEGHTVPRRSVRCKD